MSNKDFEKVLDNIEYKLNFNIPVDQESKEIFIKYYTSMEGQVSKRHQDSINKLKRILIQ